MVETKTRTYLGARSEVKILFPAAETKKEAQLIIVRNGRFVHENLKDVNEKTIGPNSVVLGMQEIVYDPNDKDSNKNIKNIWFSGEDVRLFSPDEAKKITHRGQTAFRWATHHGIEPEMVVRAHDGHFYPATTNDKVLSSKNPEKHRNGLAPISRWI